MEIGGIPLNAETIQKVFGSQAGKQLLALLNQDGGKSLREAANALQRGDQQAAAAALAPVMTTPEAQELVRKINEN